MRLAAVLVEDDILMNNPTVWLYFIPLLKLWSLIRSKLEIEDVKSGQNVKMRNAERISPEFGLHTKSTMTHFRKTWPKLYPWDLLQASASKEKILAFWAL